jgi:hypothetical protein
MFFTFVCGNIISKCYKSYGNNKPLFELSDYSSSESIHVFALTLKYIIYTAICKIARFYVDTRGEILQSLQYDIP